MPEAPTPELLQPLKSWSHPLGDKSNPLVQLTNLAKAVGGYYPLGRNGFWHGGVHFDAGTAGIVGMDNSHVRCIADGEVVAYRIDSQYPLSTLYRPDETCIQAPFATGFVLVRHRLQAPKIAGSDAAPPELTFYSLYMHLRHWAAYQEDDTLARPAFWPQGAELRVKQTVSDTFVGKPGVRGLNVRCRADHSRAHPAPVIDLLPRGTQVTLSGEGAYRKLESPRGPASLMGEGGELRGYVAFQHLSQIEGDRYRVNANTLNVRAEPNSNAGTAILGRLPRSAEVTVSGEGDFRKLESVNQYVHFESLEGQPEPQAQDSIVLLTTPVPIKAGELIGHIGDTQNNGDAHPQQYLHLEVFSGEDVETFIGNCRNWAKDLPDSGKTWLKLAAGTPVVPHQEGYSASHPPTVSAGGPTTGTDLYLPKSLLNGLRAEHRIQVPAAGSTKALNWYRLDGLLNASDFALLDGYWCCEEVGVTPWVNPWSWEGYTLIYNDTSNRENLAYSMRAENELDEEQLQRYHSLIERVEKSPLQQRLYHLIPDGDNDGKMTATELQAGLRLPAVAQSIAQLIVHYESEWYYDAQKWDALDELMGHSGSTPNPNWVTSKERVRKLSWWSEVAGSLGLPEGGEVYHFHPIGLSTAVKSDGCTCLDALTVEKVKRIASLATYENIEKYTQPLNDMYERFGVKLCISRAHILAQVLHESGCLRLTTEGLDPDAPAPAYSPYIGRGLIQISWEENYQSYGNYIGENFLGSPNYLKLSSLPHSVVSVGWFWVVFRGILKFSDVDDFVFCTAAVNGGFNGYNERLEYLNRAIDVLEIKDCAIKNLGGEYLLQDSAAHDNAKFSFAWGLWHDPGSPRNGMTKSASQAIVGYERYLELYDANESVRTHPSRTYYSSGRHALQAKNFAEQRIHALQVGM